MLRPERVRMFKSFSSYKTCKNCGNRNHVRAGQCRWCGAFLRRPIDLLVVGGTLLFLLILGGFVVFSLN